MERHALFDELEACDPRYQQKYSTLRAASEACGCVAEFQDYLRTSSGQRYVTAVAKCPDVAGDQRKEREAADSLPYTLANIGTVPYSED